MIKIQNDKIYMTAGEACYIIGLKDGELFSDYFGARIELEDDLHSLLGTGDVNEFAPIITSGNKKIKLEYVGAEVIAQKPHRASALDGGKTLVLALKSNDGKVTAEVYYTPYPRGGFSRRVVITNGTGSSLKIKNANTMRLNCDTDIISVTGDGEIVKSGSAEAGKARSVDNFIAAVADRGAYGFLSVYGDGAVVAGVSDDGMTEIDCRECDGVTVAAGESYMSPEVLAVYSFRGIDGCQRIFHDIIRESLGGKFLSERKPVVLFCPKLPVDKLVIAANSALELGCDVFAVDVGATDVNTLVGVSKACKAAGIKCGIKLDPFRVEKQSAVFGPHCKASNGKFECDLSNDAGVSELLDALERAIRDCDIEYLMIDLPRGGVQDIAHGVYTVRHTLRQKFGELNVEWGIVPDKLRHGRLLCYPPCMMRSVVRLNEGSLKSAFDKVTFGCLGYSLDPTEVSDDIKRAIRAQIFSYQNDAPIVMLGDVYRLCSTAGDVCLMSVTKDKSKAYVVCERKSKSAARIFLHGLDEHNLYNVRELNKTFSGAALISCGVPLFDSDTVCLHIRQVADYE